MAASLAGHRLVCPIVSTCLPGTCSSSSTSCPPVPCGLSHASFATSLSGTAAPISQEGTVATPVGNTSAKLEERCPTRVDLLTLVPLLLLLLVPEPNWLRELWLRAHLTQLLQVSLVEPVQLANRQAVTLQDQHLELAQPFAVLVRLPLAAVLVALPVQCFLAGERTR